MEMQIQMTLPGVDNSHMAGSKRPAPQRCRSDSTASLSQRPIKRARSVSSQLQPPSRPQSIGPEVQQQHPYPPQYQTILPQQPQAQQQHIQQHIQPLHPIQIQPSIQSQHQLPQSQQHQHRASQSISRLGLDVAAFGQDSQYQDSESRLAQLLQGAMTRRSGSEPQFSPGPSISPTVEEMNSFVQHDDNFDFEEMSNSGKKGKGKNAAMAENEDELRRLAAENVDVSLDDLATRVREDDNGPQAEKTRQIFGMSWLLRACERQEENSGKAVPRSRVYTRYVKVCGDERIKPLNPASFGKLVRLMYPEIKTRRLGVRGQSKYHYCGILIKGDEEAEQNHTFLPAETISIQSADTNPASRSQQPSRRHSLTAGANKEWLGSMPMVPGGLFDDLLDHNYNSVPVEDTKLEPEEFLQTIIYFPLPEEELDNPSEQLVLPDIHIYADPGTDLDNAASLEAIYRTHCVSLLEAIRYLQIKKLFSHFNTFQGTLTAPVQKLFYEPVIARWIEDSDWAMYKEMIRMLCPHAHSAVPAAVLNALRLISTSLANQIKDAFSGMPDHVVEARLMPARMFANLLDRMLRVNETAHASAKILSHVPDRTIMRNDWQNFVKAKPIVVREVPCRSPEVLDILKNEILRLLTPESEEDEESYLRGNGLTPEPTAPPSTQVILDNWITFLSALASRFPSASPRTLMQVTNSVANAALRDITMANGEGFGGWWVFKTWVDEYMAWTAERSGFLRYTPKREKPKKETLVDRDAQDEIVYDLMAGTGNNNKKSGNGLRNNIIASMEKICPTPPQDDPSHDDSGLSIEDSILDILGPDKFDNASLEMVTQGHV